MNSSGNQEQKAVLSLLQDIKDGRTDPSTINKEMRQLCVEMLLAEGCSVPSIAQILGRSDKTIRRDIAEIRECNAISPNADLAKKIIGEMLFYVRTHHSYLMRLARTPKVSVSERSQAEYQAALIYLQMIGKMQSLGYLPTQPQAIVGDISVTLDHDSEKSFQELQSEVIDIEAKCKEFGEISPDLQKMINDAKQKIIKGSIQSEINKIEHQTREGNNEENI